MAQEASAAPPRRSRKKLIIVVAVVLVVAGGGGAYWGFVAAPGVWADAPRPAKPPAILPIEPFVVNLADTGGRRFIRLTLGLVIEGEEHVKEFSEDTIARTRVRSALIELLSQQTAESLVTPDGKDALKKSVAAVVATHTEHLKISDVLFTEFIVQ